MAAITAISGQLNLVLANRLAGATASNDASVAAAAARPRVRAKTPARCVSGHSTAHAAGWLSSVPPSHANGSPAVASTSTHVNSPAVLRTRAW